MNVIEFNELSFDEKWLFVFKSTDVSFIAFRFEDNFNITLFNCGDFFAEVFYSPTENRIKRIEGIGFDNGNMDLYIDVFSKRVY